MSLQIQCAAVGVIDLLDAAGRIRLSRRVDYLKALRWIVKRTVIEDGTHGVPIVAAVVPNVDTAVCDHTARARKMREPVHGVDLVYHPLAGYARRVGPEQSKLKMFARIERHLLTLHAQPFPL